MYNKLFTKILDSSIWLEDHATVRVWITLLASMDEHGMCQYASGMNLARRANVTVEEAAAAVKVLEAPDPHSSDPDHEGRRIERTRGGWLVLNAPKYRSIVTRKESQRLAAERAKAYRERKKDKKKSVTNVTQRDEVAERHGTVTQSEADTDLSLKGESSTSSSYVPRPEGYDYGYGEKNELPNGFDFTEKS